MVDRRRRNSRKGVPLSFDDIPLPRWRPTGSRSDAAADLREQLGAWIGSEPLDELARAWGGAPPVDGPLERLFDWYDGFSAQHWDFRRGRERNLVPEADLTPEQTDLVMAAARALGLADSRPPELTSYDAALVLGGLVRACLVRPRYAAQLRRHGIELAQVVALGGFRPLAGDEIGLARDLELEAEDEFHAMVAGMRMAFRVGSGPSYTNGGSGDGNTDWEIASFSDAPSLSVIAAPSPEPERRANTADTYDWWAQREDGIRGARILLITTKIYVPYQGAVATRILGLDHGAEVEMIGVPDEIADMGEHTHTFRADNYLQEIRSAVRGYRQLHRSLQDHER